MKRSVMLLVGCIASQSLFAYDCNRIIEAHQKGVKREYEVVTRDLDEINDTQEDTRKTHSIACDGPGAIAKYIAAGLPVSFSSISPLLGVLNKLFSADCDNMEKEVEVARERIGERIFQRIDNVDPVILEAIQAYGTASAGGAP